MGQSNDRDPQLHDFRLPRSGRRLDPAFQAAESKDGAGTTDYGARAVGNVHVRGHEQPHRITLLTQPTLIWMAACAFCLVIGFVIGWGSSDRDQSALDKAIKEIQNELRDTRDLIKSQDDKHGDKSRELQVRFDDLERTIKTFIVELKHSKAD